MMMLHEKGKGKGESRKVLLLLPLFLSMLAVPCISAADAGNETVTDEPVSIWNIGHWFMETTGYFMHNISDKASSWFGIDPSIMILFMLILFLYVIRAKANGWVFWVLILGILFLVATGMIPLGDMI